MRISDWSSDVCSSDLRVAGHGRGPTARRRPPQRDRPSPPRGGDVRRAAARRHGGGRRHPLPALLLLPSRPNEIGRASCRERVCQYVEISVVAVSLKTKNNKQHRKRQSVYKTRK